MIRRFNYTGRKRIQERDIRINVQKGHPSSFTAELDLSRYGFSSDAQVIIEPYVRFAFQNFNFGTVGELQQPDTSLIQLPDSDFLNFRIKVVDVNDHPGQLLGLNDRIRAENQGAGEEDKESILPLDPNAEGIYPQLWNVRFDEKTPVLEVYPATDTIREEVRGPLFQSLVYPAAVRIILTQLIKDISLKDDSESWVSRWLNFTTNVLKINSPADASTDEMLEQWIDKACDKFCDKYGIVDLYKKAMQ
jgi:hypothetical protein